MGHGYKMLGFAVIIVLYVVVGVMAALGTIWINRKFLTGKQEQIFYGIFMIGMAAFYLAFTAYFDADTAWRDYWYFCKPQRATGEDALEDSCTRSPSRNSPETGAATRSPELSPSATSNRRPF